MLVIGEPNNKEDKEYCVEMSGDMLGRWNDMSCDSKFSYICRKPATTATPAPSAEPTRPPSMLNHNFINRKGCKLILIKRMPFQKKNVRERNAY